MMQQNLGIVAFLPDQPLISRDLATAAEKAGTCVMLHFMP
jgi:hypothetical protein